MKYKVKMKGIWLDWQVYTGSIRDIIDSLDPTAEFEIAFSTMDEVRKERDRLIIESDWTQTIDCPLSSEKKAEFTAYRQALRDIPQTFDNPDDIIWPAKPTL
ncbi:tail fiber assembly protein [Photobacterium damselae subsp. damselae]|uniref:tail fiber assembly protein n=1 Tax=Photobacterium damselae TaxID=38293 RepID=UPI00311B0F70